MWGLPSTTRRCQLKTRFSVGNVQVPAHPLGCRCRPRAASVPRVRGRKHGHRLPGAPLGTPASPRWFSCPAGCGHQWAVRTGCPLSHRFIHSPRRQAEQQGGEWQGEAVGTASQVRPHPRSAWRSGPGRRPSPRQLCQLCPSAWEGSFSALTKPKPRELPPPAICPPVAAGHAPVPARGRLAPALRLLLCQAAGRS